MYLWQRAVTAKWWNANGQKFQDLFGPKLAVIESREHKRLQIHVASSSSVGVRKIQRQFGGRSEKLPGDWLKRFARQQAKGKPIKIGKRLIISNVACASPSRREFAPQSRGTNRFHIFIPAGAAFGTGQHATTGMCLRMLEHALRVRPARVVVDLGTGSGILALAARELGATRVIGIDSDAVAIATAKENARQNKITGIRFHVAELSRWNLPRETDLAVANLFSELLIELLPRFHHVPRLLLSGVLRNQESDLRRALTDNGITVSKVRRRGKWVALEAKN
jgi:ribosomal protein L11 methyltransferase